MWALLLLILAAAIILRLFVPAPPHARSVAQPAGDEGILSPLVRKVLGQMPVPVMLLDDGARVLFVNDADARRGGRRRSRESPSARCCAIPRC